VGIESKAAADLGVAFFNTFEAMGGEGTMAKWYDGEPRLVGADFIHPMPAGARIVGELLYNALRDGYNEYKLRQLKELETRAEARASSRSEP
jgi:lysophospholipase L1-like esterase